MFEEKYSRPGSNYYASRIWRSITSVFYSYPEFRFLLKVLVALVIILTIFYFIRGAYAR